MLLCSVNNVFAAEDGLLLECTAEDVFSVDVIVAVPFLWTFGFVAVVGSTQRKKRHWDVVVLFFLTVAVLGMVGLTAVLGQKEK